jgi:hypothetical protein
MELHNRKERSDMILEPLQVMTQLAILSHSPIGTKVSVSNNILQLHPPTFWQGAYRWYNSDGKDDLYYLYHAIRRYYKWYKSENTKINNYILTTGIKGLDKLRQTYASTEQTAITHTLQLYQNVLSLDSPDIFKSTSAESVNMDTVFENIKTQYDNKLLKIIYNTLLILDETTDNNKPYYINGLLKIVCPTNDKLRIWIRENLTC